MIDAAHLALKNKIIPKEQMQKFISKKREMFMMQMNIDQKKNEIKNLENLILKKKDGLKQVQKNLKGDIEVFNNFWVENKNKSKFIGEKADNENKLKLEKIKKLKDIQDSKTSKINNNIKLLEKLEEYFKYKEFLDGFRDNYTIDNNLSLNNKVQTLKNELKMLYNINLSDKLIKIIWENDDYNNIIFNNTSELMHKFIEMEENNLFHIKKCQEIEKENDDLNEKFNEIKKEYEKNLNHLKENSKLLKNKITDEKEKIKNLDQIQTDSVKEIEASVKNLENELVINNIYNKNKRSIDILLNLEKSTMSLLKVINTFTNEEKKTYEKKLNDRRPDNKRDIREIEIKEEKIKKFKLKSKNALKFKTRKEMKKHFIEKKTKKNKENNKVNEEELEYKLYFS